MTATLRSLATANPPLYVTGEQAYRLVADRLEMSAKHRDLYRRLLRDGPIRGRYLALDGVEQALQTSPDEQLGRFRKFATATASRAAGEAIAAAGLRPADIGGLVVNTCTGYLCPGLSSYLAESLGLGASVHTMDLTGMGCGGAIPNLHAAAGMLALGQPGPGVRPRPRPVLSVAVEVCSATFFHGPEAGLIVSNCIFGDGAAAAVVDADGDAGPEAGGDPPRAALARLIDFESAVLPEHREELRYRHEQGRLRNVLGPRVPVLAARAVKQVAHRLLARHGLGIGQIDWWVVHPGGTAVLERVAKQLGLGPESLRVSYEVFRDYGNMSSPSVLFVLRRILDQCHPRSGQKGMLLSFGAGFTAFAAMVQF